MASFSLLRDIREFTRRDSISKAGIEIIIFIELPKYVLKHFFFFFIICHRLLDQPNAPHFPLSLLPTPEDLQRPHGGAIGHIEDHWSRVFETGLVLSGV